MSRTYELLCHDCRVGLWIGQGSGEKAYIYGTDEAQKALRDFLFGHQNHRLEFGDDEPFSGLDYKSLDSDSDEGNSPLGTSGSRHPAPSTKIGRETAGETAPPK